MPESEIAKTETDVPCIVVVPQLVGGPVEGLHFASEDMHWLSHLHNQAESYYELADLRLPTNIATLADLPAEAREF